MPRSIDYPCLLKQMLLPIFLKKQLLRIFTVAIETLKWHLEDPCRSAIDEVC